MMSQATANARNTHHVIEFLENQTLVFSRLCQKASKKPTEKTIHELRVAVRRIRAVLWIFRHGTPQVCLKKLNKDLRRLGQHLGRLRELDVAIKDSKKYELKSRKLKRKRESEYRSLSKLLTSKHTKNILRDISKILKQTKTLDRLHLEDATTTLQNRILLWRKKRISGSKQLHLLRITIKKSRYVLEAIKKPTRPLRTLQTILGDAHDLEVLQELTGANSLLRHKQDALNIDAMRKVQKTLRFALCQLEKQPK